MKQLEQDAFYRYRFLSNLNYNPTKEEAIFVVSKVNEDISGYEMGLNLLKEGKVTPLTPKDEVVGSYVFEDDHTILYKSLKGKDKEKVSQGYVLSSYYRLSLSDRSAPEKAFTLPLEVSSLTKIKKDLYLVSAMCDVDYPDYYLMNDEDMKKVHQDKKDNEDYQIMDEYPYFYNGAGYINKTRSSLYLYDAKNEILERIVVPQMDVESVALSDDKTRILYSGIAFDKVKLNCSQVYEYNLETKETVILYNKDDMAIQKVFYEKDKVIVFGTFGHDYGWMENGKFYTLNQNEMTLYIDFDYSLHGQAGSDCRYGSGKNFLKDEGIPYFGAMDYDHTHLMRIHNHTLESLMNENVSIDDFQIKGNKVLFIGMFTSKLQEIYEYDLETKEFVQLTHLNDNALEDYYVAIPEKLTVPSHTYDVHGWVLKPKDYDPTKTYPAILDIHGGPKTSYGEVFYHEMQYWANLGYFVFFCNPTGSDGRGNAFADLRKVWGQPDYQDIMNFTDGVLKAYPQIDSSRVAVTGGSYGGFMTNWIIGHTDRFVCAVSQRSISNWISEVCASDYGIDFPMESGYDDIYNCMEELWEQSPLKYVNNAVTPTLFIHSFEDYRCPLPEAMQMYTALICRGVDSKICAFKGENHELSRSGKPKHRSKRLYEITSWIEKYTK